MKLIVTRLYVDELMLYNNLKIWGTIYLKRILDLKCTLFKYLNAKVAQTPRPKTNKYGRNLKLMLGFFFIKNDTILNFLSEYGGYFALQLKN